MEWLPNDAHLEARIERFEDGPSTDEVTLVRAATELNAILVEKKHLFSALFVGEVTLASSVMLANLATTAASVEVSPAEGQRLLEMTDPDARMARLLELARTWGTGPL